MGAVEKEWIYFASKKDMNLEGQGQNVMDWTFVSPQNLKNAINKEKVDFKNNWRELLEMKNIVIGNIKHNRYGELYVRND